MTVLGSHISLSSPTYFLGAAKEAESFGLDTFMFYTGAPQNTKRKPLEEMMIQEGLDHMRQAKLRSDRLVVHAPYIINLGNKDNLDTYDLGKTFLLSELRRTEAFGSKLLVLHPGAHVGHDERHGLESLLLGLNEVLSQDGTDVTLCLETMAGKGSEIGTRFEFFKEVIERIDYPDRIGVCLDTCHVSDAGYDASNASLILDEFDRVLGLDRLKVVHLNDTKNPRGAHKDRHENIGFGYLGFDALRSYVIEPRLDEIPIILETPHIGEVAPYKKEVAMLRSGIFDPLWRESL